MPVIVLRPYAQYLRLALVALFFLATTAVWISLDRSPGAWDDSWYLTNSLTLYDTLADHGLIAYWKKFLSTLEFKPPLIAVLPTPLYRLFGRSAHVAYGVNLVFMVLLLGSVYRLAGHYSSPRAGFVAVYVTGTMPLLYGLSRQYLVEYGLTALVAATICCLVTLHSLQVPRNAFWLGVLGGFGLMMKATFPLYVLLPFAFACIRSGRVESNAASDLNPQATRLRPSLLMALLAFASPLALIALPWYARNWSKTLDHALKSSFSPMADLYGMGNPFSFAVIWRYVAHWVNDGISGAYFLLLVILAGIAVWRKAGLKQPGLPREGVIHLSLWFLPFSVFLFGRNKDIRFTAPLLPAVAIAVGWMTDSLLRSVKRWVNVVVAVSFALPLLAYLHTSFGLLGKTRLTWGDLVLLAPRLSHARPPDTQAWPHQEILQLLRLSSPYPDERKILLGSDTPHFNANNFELAAAEGLDSFQISTSAYEEDLPSLLNAANTTMFFIYKEGGESGPGFTNRLIKPLLEDVQNGGKFYRWSVEHHLPGLPDLPDGGRVVVFQNSYPNSAVLGRYFFDAGVDSNDIEKPTCEVSFSNGIRLTGLSFAIEEHWLKVSYTWRSNQSMDRDLYCFTHILGNQGQILGFLDHAVPSEPARGWKESWGAREVLRYCLPDGVSDVQLRLGLFRKSTGERHKIREARALDGPKLSITENETAVLATGMSPLLPMRAPGDQ